MSNQSTLPSAYGDRNVLCSCKSSTVDLEWNDVGLILELQQNFDLNGLLFSKIVGES